MKELNDFDARNRTLQSLPNRTRPVSDLGTLWRGVCVCGVCVCVRDCYYYYYHYYLEAKEGAFYLGATGRIGFVKDHARKGEKKTHTKRGRKGPTQAEKRKIGRERSKRKRILLQTSIHKEFLQRG